MVMSFFQTSLLGNPTNLFSPTKDGNPAFSKRMVEPFLQSEGQGLRQHVGLMTSSHLTLIGNCRQAMM